MRIESLSVKNFKGFKERTFCFPQNFTLLVGENGSGKTSVLEAINTVLPLITEEAPHDLKFSLTQPRVETLVIGGVKRFEPLSASVRILVHHQGKSYEGNYPLQKLIRSKEQGPKGLELTRTPGPGSAL